MSDGLKLCPLCRDREIPSSQDTCSACREQHYYDTHEPDEPPTVQYRFLPPKLREKADKETWAQLTTAVGSDQIGLGWAGMTMRYALINHTSGRLAENPNGEYYLLDDDLGLLLGLVEHSPTKHDCLEADDDQY